MNMYYRKLGGGGVIVNARPEHAPQMEELQKICFPTLADQERFKSVHYLKHIQLFGSGQFVALNGLNGRLVIGATTTLRLNFDFEHVHHTFADVIGGGWLTAHQPDGEWLYGADISVRPENRGGGIATTLYAARQDLVWKLGLKGQITAGMIPGYSEVKDKMSAQAYFQGVVSRRIKDPTLSMQMKVGFEPRALLANYINDPVSDNYAGLLVLQASKCVPGATFQDVGGACAERYVGRGNPPAGAGRPGK